MTYLFNPEFRLDRRSVPGYGDVHFLVRNDSDEKMIVLDARAKQLVEKLLSNQPYTPCHGEHDTLEYFFTEDIVSKLDCMGNAGQRRSESLNFWIQTSDRCNLACTYCYIPSLNSTKERRPDLFSLLGKKILEVNGLRYVSIKLAGGEPLLSFNDWADEITKLKQRLAEANIRLNVRIISNLTFLNKRIIEYIKSNDFGISISLDGTSIFNDKNRIFSGSGKGSFHIVKKNLNILLENDIKPSVMITATSENRLGVGELVKYLVANDLVFRVSDAKGGYINPTEFELIFSDIKRSLSRAIKARYPVSERIIVSDLRTLSPEANPCSMGTTGAALYLDGAIYFCHTEFAKGTPLGNLDEEDGLLDIISRGYYKHLGISSDCRACEYRFVCAGGCPLYRINGKSPMCSAYKKIIPQIFELYDAELPKI